MHVNAFYLNLPCVVGYDETQQDDCGQADQTLQGQGIHGALQRENGTLGIRGMLQKYTFETDFVMMVGFLVVMENYRICK